jgi:hypothetical protein
MESGRDGVFPSDAEVCGWSDVFAVNEAPRSSGLTFVFR